MSTQEHLFQSRKVSESKLNQVMKPQQFDRIIEAILAGKYSWACVLILSYAGYNPLHYIPYRTYNRLMKNNSQGSTSTQLPKEDRHKSQKSPKTNLGQPSYQIDDLSYLEIVSQKDKQLHGGNRPLWLLSEIY